MKDSLYLITCISITRVSIGLIVGHLFFIVSFKILNPVSISVVIDGSGVIVFVQKTFLCIPRVNVYISSLSQEKLYWLIYC